MNSPGPALAGTGSALETPPSLPEPTCIPPVDVAPAVEAQACEVSTVWANGRRQVAHHDSDGRLLKLLTHDSQGTLVSVETHVWRDGVELQRRVSHAGGGFDQSDWIYDAQRLVQRIDQGSRYRLTEYEYNDPGRRSWSTTYDSQGTPVDWSDYSYDAQGRLTGIDSSPRCDLNFSRCENRSYWPDGRLRFHEWFVGYNLSYSEEYNELGQLIGSTWATGSAGGASETRHTYDSTGRLSQSVTHTVGEGRRKDALATRAYTKGGWRERFAEDYLHCGNYPGDPCSYDYQRITQRASFLCGTSAVALQEWDINEDGIVDASRTHTRDETGRLVREEYSGTPGMDDGPLLREFHYDCQ